MIERNKVILALSRAIQATFSASEWTELGYLTNTDEWIDRHPRLLRSLSWGDSDYKGHVLDALKHILGAEAGNLQRVLEYQPITGWLSENEPDFLAALAGEVYGREVAHVAPAISTDSGLAALADAQELLRVRGPSSAVDRVHTGLHAFLKAACSSAHIPFSHDANANRLLRLLLDQHPALRNLGRHSDDIRRMIQTSASIVDSLGTLRNQASLAHPNEELLGPDEALLTINLSRSLLRYLDTKLSGKKK